MHLGRAGLMGVRGREQWVCPELVGAAIPMEWGLPCISARGTRQCHACQHAWSRCGAAAMHVLLGEGLGDPMHACRWITPCELGSCVVPGSLLLTWDAFLPPPLC